jgi:hypothetical protein
MIVGAANAYATRSDKHLAFGRVRGWTALQRELTWGEANKCVNHAIHLASV